MPVPNDLSPEEQAMFGEHGVAPAGEGGEPLAEENQQQQGQQQEDQGGEPQAQPQHGDRQPPEQPQISNRRADGTFKSKEEMDAELAALNEQQQQGQQQSQGQGQPQQQGQQPDNRTVPLAALHESRQREAQFRQQLQLATARMNAMLAAQQGQNQPNLPQMPDLNEDPAGYIMALEQRLASFEQTRQEEQQNQQLDNAINQDEELFKQSVPDYDAASDHYVQSRAAELLAIHSPQDAQRIMMREARQMAQVAWQRGQSVGQMVYQMAQARGYQPQNTSRDPMRFPVQGQQPQQQFQQPTQPQQQNGQQQRNGPSAQAIVNGVQQGQQASRSLSGGQGSSTTQLNADALLNMSDEEFEAYLRLGNKGANERFAAIG